MTISVTSLIDQVKRFSLDERNLLFEKLLDDPELRSDLFDLMLVYEAEAGKQKTVSLDDYIAGKRTYDVQ